MVVRLSFVTVVGHVTKHEHALDCTVEAHIGGEVVAARGAISRGWSRFALTVCITNFLQVKSAIHLYPVTESY